MSRRPRRPPPLYALLMPPGRKASRILRGAGAKFPVTSLWRPLMADLLFLALGLGAFALFGLYAALLRKV